MLRQLHISGLGIIDDLDLELDAGLNVLTGETGAGKTMITVGLALALGARGSASLVRPGARAARVQARFDGPLPDAAADWIEDDELVFGRTVGRDGKSSVRVGGQIATVGTLTSLAPELVEVHGQHASQRLLSPAAHAAFLDRFAGAEHTRLLCDYRDGFDRLRAGRARLAELAELERDREREIDLLAYQANEIESADIRPGEAEALSAEEARLGNAERLAEVTGAAAARLGDDGGGADALRAAAADLEQAAAVDRELGEVAARASSAAEETAELARDLRRYAEGSAPDPDRLEHVRARLQEIRTVRRKYGDDDDDVLAYLESVRARLDAIRGADDERERLAESVHVLEDECRARALRLTSGRADAATALAAALDEELRELGMEGAAVSVALRPLEEPGPSGAERIDLGFTGGPGQATLPLARTASGGELSRVMLACRSVLADLDEVPTLIFDEIDAGIGGRAGVAIGRRLARLASTRQVLVVTHLPQIASFADRHVRVRKREGTASVAVLDGDERIVELSRMLSGLPGSDAAAGHAEELLLEAGRAKASAR